MKAIVTIFFTIFITVSANALLPCENRETEEATGYYASLKVQKALMNTSDKAVCFLVGGFEADMHPFVRDALSTKDAQDLDVARSMIDLNNALFDMCVLGKKSKSEVAQIAEVTAAKIKNMCSRK